MSAIMRVIEFPPKLPIVPPTADSMTLSLVVFHPGFFILSVCLRFVYYPDLLLEDLVGFAIEFAEIEHVVTMV